MSQIGHLSQLSYHVKVEARRQWPDGLNGESHKVYMYAKWEDNVDDVMYTWNRWYNDERAKTLNVINPPTGA